MGDSLTVAFAFEALDVLSDPAAAVGDARTWSTYVGVASARPSHHVVNGLRERGIYAEDFLARLAGRTPPSRLAAEFDTDRHVFVGDPDTTGVGDEAVWDVLPIDDAAGRAGWELAASAPSPAEGASE